jgi:hypothetical protein
VSFVTSFKDSIHLHPSGYDENFSAAVDAFLSEHNFLEEDVNLRSGAKSLFNVVLFA